MAARPQEPEFQNPVSAPGLPAAMSQLPAAPEQLPAQPDWAALLPPDPDPDWASTDRAWVEYIPVLIDSADRVADPYGDLLAAEAAAGSGDDWPEDDEDEWAPEPEPGTPPDPRRLLPADTAGPVCPFEMAFEEAVDGLAAVRRAQAWLEARQARLLMRLQVLALDDCPAAAEPEGADAMAQPTEELSVSAVAEEAAAALRIPRGEAAAALAAARRLTGEFKATFAALEDGDITNAQANVIIDQARSLPEGARQGFEAELLRTGTLLHRQALADKARRLREKRHPESIAARRAASEASRCVELRPMEDGMAWLGIYLPAEQAVGAFNRIQDAALALKSRTEPRTLTQLRADVAARLLLAGTAPAEDSAKGTGGTLPGLGHGLSAQVVITVPMLSLLGVDAAPADLQGYGPIPADVAARLAAGAPSLARLLTDPVDGAPLALDRTAYRPTAVQRRWLAAVHPRCTFFGCGRSTRSCDFDHVVPWSAGQGTTNVDNLRPECRGHHRLKTAGLWSAARPPGDKSATEWTSPAGRTYTSKPEPLATTPPEALSTLLERLEVRDLNEKLQAAYERRRAAGRIACPDPPETAPPF